MSKKMFAYLAMLLFVVLAVTTVDGRRPTKEAQCGGCQTEESEQEEWVEADVEQDASADEETTEEETAEDEMVVEEESPRNILNCAAKKIRGCEKKTVASKCPCAATRTVQSSSVEAEEEETEVVTACPKRTAPAKKVTREAKSTCSTSSVKVQEEEVVQKASKTKKSVEKQVKVSGSKTGNKARPQASKTKTGASPSSAKDQKKRGTQQQQQQQSAKSKSRSKL